MSSAYYLVLGERKGWAAFLPRLSFPGCPALAGLSQPSCSSPLVPSLSVSAVLFLLSYPGRPVLCPVQADQADLSRLTYPSRPVYCHTYCTVPDVLSRLYCHGCPASVVLSPVIVSQLLCLCCPVLSSCPACTISSVLSGCSVPAVQSMLSCPSCPVSAVRTQLP
jgi:hypothetical protein